MIDIKINYVAYHHELCGICGNNKGGYVFICNECSRSRKKLGSSLDQKVFDKLASFICPLCVKNVNKDCAYFGAINKEEIKQLIAKLEL